MTTPTLATALILQWLTSRLKSDATLAALIGDRVEIDEAYEDIAFPYILITSPDPGRPYYKVGARAATRNGVYLVRGVQQGRGISADLLTIAGQIISSLHGQRDQDAGIVSCILTEEYKLSYPLNEQTYVDLGGLFAISAEG